ncbi:MAG: hypothetical protein WCH60_04380, partial [Burkholderiales bacterium]
QISKRPLPQVGNGLFSLSLWIHTMNRCTRPLVPHSPARLAALLTSLPGTSIGASVSVQHLLP